jgi:hypothetical protein
MLVAPAAAVLIHTARPTVRPTSMQPLVVAVAHFKPREHVRITVDPPGSVRRVVVRRDGTLSVSFPTLAVDRCSGLNLYAVGASGARADWQLKLPMKACSPAP